MGRQASDQNTSHAVMAQRSEPHDSLDFFPTPPWATQALCKYIIKQTGMHVAMDPACGDGAMVLPLREYFMAVLASDIHDYGCGFPVSDFLFPGGEAADWIITNPPFRLAEQFIARALDVAEVGVAVLVRTVFIESVGRYERMFKDTPPAIFAPFVERVPMVKGRLDAKASSATSYAWFVWRKDWPYETKVMWIPPCRKDLERPGDYEVTA